MKFHIRLLIGLVVFLAAFGVARSFQGGPSVTRRVTPFSSVVREVFMDKLTTRYLTAFRSDGASVHVPLATTDGSVQYEGRNIKLPLEQKHTAIYDALRAKSTYYLHPDVASFAGKVKLFPSCSDRAMDQGKLEGSEVLAGLTTHHWLAVRRDASGSFEREDLWVSPQIDCRTVRRTIKKDGATQFLVETESVTHGEPDANLFIPPVGYREIAPSQAAKETEFLKRGVTLNPNDEKDKCVLGGLIRLDKQYFDSQKYRPVGR